MAELEKKTDKAEDLKKALSLFTFQGQMERYKPQRGSRLPLVPMLASLREMSPRQWAAYAFGRDPLRGKFTPEQMQELSDKALACGQEEASKLLDTHHGKVEPTLLARELGRGTGQNHRIYGYGGQGQRTAQPPPEPGQPAGQAQY